MRKPHAAASAVFVVLALAGCSNASDNYDAGGSSGGDASSADKYTQTWPTQYSETTCDDWNQQMTPAQQFAAAADILSSARDKIDGATGVAPDGLIVQFQSGITNVCVIGTMTLTDATYGLYESEPKFHP